MASYHLGVVGGLFISNFSTKELTFAAWQE